MVKKSILKQVQDDNDKILKDNFEISKRVDVLEKKVDDHIKKGENKNSGLEVE